MLKLINGDTVTLVSLDNVDIIEKGASSRDYYLKVGDHTISYGGGDLGKARRDDDFETIMANLHGPLHGGKQPMQALKEYIRRHQDLLFTVGLVILLDHFIFGGAFQEKLKQLLNRFLDKHISAADGK